MRLFIALLAGTLLLTGCFKEKSAEPDVIPPTPQYPWRFEVGTQSYIGAVESIQVDSVAGAAVMTISGVDTVGKGRISLSITGTDLVPGTYKSPSASFVYTEDLNTIYQSVNGADSFAITINSISSSQVTGSFTGSIRSLSGGTTKLSNGSFSGLR
ncbi:MAG TPA: hypothetical protein PLQ32_09785 [Flavihumibacter sp.]|mgnify:CR=1 FL=1|nr:hypothetical protein [Bacteroidota bacterium]HOA39267.1 hypothetical protein [Flavihumibacter sp.]HPZ88383.1 hypothetical protein [Flavihumibacter sp.]HQD08708.1 hypothetical protein [Flavihumibacter sp.]